MTNPGDPPPPRGASALTGDSATGEGRAPGHETLAPSTHWVRNQLQSLVSLLRLAQMAGEPAGETIDVAVSHVLVVAAVLRLGGTGPDSGVPIRELVAVLLSSLPGSLDLPVCEAGSADAAPRWLGRQQLLPVALAVSVILSLAQPGSSGVDPDSGIRIDGDGEALMLGVNVRLAGPSNGVLAPRGVARLRFVQRMLKRLGADIAWDSAAGHLEVTIRVPRPQPGAAAEQG